MQATTKEKFSRGWNASLNQMGKLGEQRHMAALRDGFALLVPLIVAASIGVICMTFVFGWWDTVSTSILGWITWAIPGQVFIDQNGIVKFVANSVAFEISANGTFIFYTIWKGIFSYLSIFATLTISYSLARIKGIKDPFIAAAIGLGAFMILTYGQPSLFGATGLMVAMLSSILSIELFSFFEKNPKLELKMPAGVPPAVGRSFSKLFPTMFTLLLILTLQAPFLIITALGTGMGWGDWFSIGKAISDGIQAPFLELVNSSTGSFTIGFVYVFFGAFLWFFGLHGTNILTGVFSAVFIAGLDNNLRYKAGELGLSPTVIADGTFDAFIFFGGIGSALALVFVGLLFSKKKAEREIMKFGAAPTVFNINEPIIFGLPLVLNFTYLIPFVFSQVTLFVITWLTIEVWQLVPPVIIKIPWTTPLAIGGFLATSSWQGILLSLFNFAVASVIWFPFILLSNKQAKKRGEEIVKIDYRGGVKQLASRFSSNKKGDN